MKVFKSSTYYKNIPMPCFYTHRTGVTISVVSLYRFILPKIVQAVFYGCFIAVVSMHSDAYAETGSPACLLITIQMIKYAAGFWR